MKPPYKLQTELWELDFRGKTYFIDPSQFHRACRSLGIDSRYIRRINLEKELYVHSIANHKFLESVSRVVIPIQED